MLRLAPDSKRLVLMVMSLLLIIFNLCLCSHQWVLDSVNAEHGHQAGLGQSHSHLGDDAESSDHDCCIREGCDHPDVQVSAERGFVAMAIAVLLPDPFVVWVGDFEEPRTVHIWASAWAHAPPSLVQGRGPPAFDGLLPLPSMLNASAPFLFNPTV